ncbi:hypothetical protein ABW21_db0202341 [Orbilia brochopaga]|nr:hypothetical protein ABW21_db0202341 [Drechslerella brochopaga]
MSKKHTPGLTVGGSNRHHIAPPQPWQHDTFSCFDDMGKCCLGFWCPCIMYGRIHYRLRHTNMEGHKDCNSICWSFCGLSACCLQWIMGTMQRSEIRHQYNLKGHGRNDCVRHFFCEPCTLIQEERETETRKSLLILPNLAGYTTEAGMTYPTH